MGPIGCSETLVDVTWWFGDVGFGLVLHGAIESDPVWLSPVQRFVHKLKATSHIEVPYIRGKTSSCIQVNMVYHDFFLVQMLMFWHCVVILSCFKFFPNDAVNSVILLLLLTFWARQTVLLCKLCHLYEHDYINYLLSLIRQNSNWDVWDWGNQDSFATETGWIWWTAVQGYFCHLCCCLGHQHRTLQWPSSWWFLD